MHTQGSFLIAAEGKRAVHKIPSSPAASTRESGKGGRLGGETLPFAAGCLNSHNADNQTYAGAAIAGAAFSRTCSVAHLAAQQISPERLLRGLKLGALKPIFRRARLQRSGLGL